MYQKFCDEGRIRRGSSNLSGLYGHNFCADLRRLFCPECGLSIRLRLRYSIALLNFKSEVLRGSICLHNHLTFRLQASFSKKIRALPSPGIFITRMLWNSRASAAAVLPTLPKLGNSAAPTRRAFATTSPRKFVLQKTCTDLTLYCMEIASKFTTTRASTRREIAKVDARRSANLANPASVTAYLALLLLRPNVPTNIQVSPLYPFQVHF